jgi:hypothetical protein
MTEPESYRDNVFINCPFDSTYRPLFYAIVFTVHACGFKARCALEEDNTADIRIQKIIRIIDQCHYGIHDLSKADLDQFTQLARFNMPLELGIFIGAHHFAAQKSHNRSKKFIVMDTEPFRYQKFISDINGQDIRTHGSETSRVIENVRNFLATSSDKRLPGPSFLLGQYEEFQEKLPQLCEQLRWKVKELTFLDYVNCVVIWLTTSMV